MSKERNLRRQRSYDDSITVVKENLICVNTDLTSLFCKHGANVYIFSYEHNGVRRHTFIDAGDSHYRNSILSVLTDNDINPANIDRIIITHGHADHYGLAYLLAKESKAKVIARPNSGGSVGNLVGQKKQSWPDSDVPSQLQDCDIEYLYETDTSKAVNIGGVDFVKLMDTIEIGQGGRLEIVGCPQTMITHSPDQLIVFYSPLDDPHPHEQSNGSFRPTDDIIFSGDLWLMRGPMFHHNMLDVSWHWRRNLYRMKSLMYGGNMARRDPRNQDSEAKEALKKGFCLIRVKPGHGPEFLGTRIIPIGLLAERDILIELGYPLSTDKSTLKLPELASKVLDKREKAYINFVGELSLWLELGYNLEEIAELLARIYTEQSGGGPLVEEDRKERRGLLKATLDRMKEDEALPDWAHQLAVISQSRLKSIS
jgi:hypothetical protein